MCAACSPRRRFAATVQENALREWQRLLEVGAVGAGLSPGVEIRAAFAVIRGNGRRFSSKSSRGVFGPPSNPADRNNMTTRLFILMVSLLGLSLQVFAQSPGGRGKTAAAVAKEVSQAVAASPGSATEVVASFVEAYPQFAEAIVKEAIAAAKEVDGNRATPKTVAAMVETVLRGSPKGTWASVVQTAVAMAPDAVAEIAVVVQSVAPGNSALAALVAQSPLNQPGGANPDPGNADPGSGGNSSGGRPPVVNPPVVDPPPTTRVNPGPPPFSNLPQP